MLAVLYNKLSWFVSEPPKKYLNNNSSVDRIQQYKKVSRKYLKMIYYFCFVTGYIPICIEKPSPHPSPIFPSKEIL